MKQKQEYEYVNDSCIQITVSLKEWQVERIKKIAEGNTPIPVSMNAVIRYIISDWLAKNPEELV